jgi:RNA polymerase sigma-70 factor (ECF subfamily)
MISDIQCASGGAASLTFEDLVARYYDKLYQFAFALTRSEADAWDLTQETFYVWAVKGQQLRDVSKVKTWMFTTLHRAFLGIRRKQTRFPHIELSEVESELPEMSPARISEMDSAQVLQALAQVDEPFQAPVALFYLEDCAYGEIAQRLGLPLGTVKSRIARGIAQLRKLLGGSVVPGPHGNGAEAAVARNRISSCVGGKAGFDRVNRVSSRNPPCIPPLGKGRSSNQDHDQLLQPGSGCALKRHRRDRVRAWAYSSPPLRTG